MSTTKKVNTEKAVGEILRLSPILLSVTESSDVSGNWKDGKNELTWWYLSGTLARMGKHTMRIRKDGHA